MCEYTNLYRVCGVYKKYALQDGMKKERKYVRINVYKSPELCYYRKREFNP